MTASGDEQDDRERLERELAGVRPLARGKERVRATTRRRAAPRADDEPEKEFVREGEGEAAGFYASDLGRDPLLRLRRAEVDVSLLVDLHGHDADRARRAVESVFAEAVRRQARGLRIIHGRGLHSPGSPVLGDLVRELLQRPPLAARVAAFAPAPRSLGGAGAIVVCLRRTRDRAST